MPPRMAEPRRRAFEKMKARDMVRLVNLDTGEYLHLDGVNRTADRNHSWLGFIYQAETLMERAEVRGEPLTGFSIIPRRYMEITHEIHKEARHD